MPQFDGSYTRQASGKIYDYLLTYGMRGKVLSWMAAVYEDEAERGHPSGEISFELPPPEDEQQRVARENTEAAIEALRGVEP